ncbi:hypothetical protein BV25DRAFT_321394 [Artomyces pyxidatus]|uniref:Uncharacterized protein n=1 Tax=Artomyces pyxidatus TaxID=48021 RepID=A0ACB8T6D4_9AGAM|nr:hypothetical protein BV25DRAFT_321394 [Artomyces pyxidatus]
MIQAGKYAEAIKLERQFASVPHGRQAPQAADRRRKMVEGLLSAMPAIERLEVEDELMTLGQKIAKPTSNGAPADLTMSWEEISPVSRPLGTAVPTSKPFVLGRSARGARFSDSAMASPPSHAHSPSLVPGKSHYPSTSPAMVQPIRHSTHTLSNSQQALPLLQPLSQSPTAPLATSTNGLRFSQGNSARTTVPSLFAPTTSTNQKPRPFVQQPPPVNGTNGVSAGESSYFEAPMPIDGLGSEGDVDMHVEDFEDEPDERRADVGPAPAEFSHSVFLNANSGTEAARHKRAEPSVERLPPGAFHAEEDGFETMSARSHQPPSPSSYPPPAKSRKTQNSLARRGTEASLDRSIPGGFFADEEVELGRRHEEDEDEVPPLPAVSPVKRATRKARSSRASSVDVEEDGPTTKPRRSTRLSVASSSPEPASPPKISASKTRKTRAAASTTSTAKAATRRKR